MSINLKNGKTIQIIRIIAESTFATQVELADKDHTIIFIQNAQIKSIVN